jgi:uncharacterized protein
MPRPSTHFARAPLDTIGCVLMLCFTLVMPAAALDFPVLAGRVVDEAGVLDQPTRSALTSKLANLESQTTDQFVVVTLKSLQGTTIEDFGVQLGRRWQLGQRGKNNGVLLIVAPNERKVRIEVGYGLEAMLTDAITKFIIETAIIPRFRANDFPGGISRGVDDIIQVLTGDAEDWKQRAAARPTASPSNSFDNVFAVFFFVIAGFIIINALFNLLHRMLMAPGGATKRPRSGFWYWDDQANGPMGPSSGYSSAGGSSGGFSGGGGSFGGGGSSGSW